MLALSQKVEVFRSVWVMCLLNTEEPETDQHTEAKREWVKESRGVRVFVSGPSEQDSGEFGPDHLQQLRVEKVLTQAEGAPVTRAHAAQADVAAEKKGTDRRQALCSYWAGC